MFATLPQPIFTLDTAAPYDVAYYQPPLGLSSDNWGRKRIIVGENWYGRMLKRAKLTLMESMLKVQQMAVEFPNLDPLSVLTTLHGFEPHPALTDLSHASEQRGSIEMRFPGAAGVTSVFATPQSDALKLVLRKIHLDDALLWDNWRLEYLALDYGFPHYRLLLGKRIIGVRDVTSHHLLPAIHEGLALYLTEAACRASTCDLVPFGAITGLDAIKHRLPPLFLINDEERKGRRPRWALTDTTPVLIFNATNDHA